MRREHWYRCLASWMRSDCWSWMANPLLALQSVIEAPASAQACSKMMRCAPKKSHKKERKERIKELKTRPLVSLPGCYERGHGEKQGLFRTLGTQLPGLRPPLFFPFRSWSSHSDAALPALSSAEAGPAFPRRGGEVVQCSLVAPNVSKEVPDRKPALPPHYPNLCRWTVVTQCASRYCRQCSQQSSDRSI